MQTQAITRTISHGTPPRRFLVTCTLGSRQVLVESRGRVDQFTLAPGRHYTPGGKAISEQAIEYFLLREQLEAELAAAGQARARELGAGDRHERQLPRGDRT